MWLKCQNRLQRVWCIRCEEIRTHKGQRHLSGKQDLCLRECAWIHPDSPPTRGWKRPTGSDRFRRTAKVTETSQNTFKPFQPGVGRHGKQHFFIKPHNMRWSHCGFSSPFSFLCRFRSESAGGLNLVSLRNRLCLCDGF